jgi:hypothetical protein
VSKARTKRLRASLRRNPNNRQCFSPVSDR